MSDQEVPGEPRISPEMMEQFRKLADDMEQLVAKLPPVPRTRHEFNEHMKRKKEKE